ncbi:hypothetical protein PUN28_012978 [Cardiocondyla obscurior]|uniref:ATP synthase F0 subunit 8 n=1 Tax=Cardiocondyla obscurior TaxID=286306 RepID=A0AAW2FB71_9HYME
MRIFYTCVHFWCFLAACVIFSLISIHSCSFKFISIFFIIKIKLYLVLKTSNIDKIKLNPCNLLYI